MTALVNYKAPKGNRRSDGKNGWRKVKHDKSNTGWAWLHEGEGLIYGPCSAPKAQQKKGIVQRIKSWMAKTIRGIL